MSTILFAACRNRPIGCSPEGKTLMLAAGWRGSAIVAAADTIRPTAAQAIAELRELGIQPVMMTGDNTRTAEAVACALGIERVFAEVLPQDKAEGVIQLQKEGKFVAMVGDGVNDALPRASRPGDRDRVQGRT